MAPSYLGGASRAWEFCVAYLVFLWVLHGCLLWCPVGGVAGHFLLVVLLDGWHSGGACQLHLRVMLYGWCELQSCWWCNAKPRVVLYWFVCCTTLYGLYLRSLFDQPKFKPLFCMLLFWSV